MNGLTITQMLDAMDTFVAKGREIEASDLSFEAKQSRLTGLMETCGLAV